MCSSSGLLYKTKQLHLLLIRLDEIHDGYFLEETFTVSKELFANTKSLNECGITKHQMTMEIVQNHISDVSHIAPLSKIMKLLVQSTRPFRALR
jgi:hypothetical protein